MPWPENHWAPDNAGVPDRPFVEDAEICTDPINDVPDIGITEDNCSDWSSRDDHREPWNPMGNVAVYTPAESVELSQYHKPKTAKFMAQALAILERECGVNLNTFRPCAFIVHVDAQSGTVAVANLFGEAGYI